MRMKTICLCGFILGVSYLLLGEQQVTKALIKLRCNKSQASNIHQADHLFTRVHGISVYGVNTR